VAKKKISLTTRISPNIQLKSVLLRGIDPARKGNTQKNLQAIPGFKNVTFVEATDDEEFISTLKEGLQGYGTKAKAQYDVVVFTPGLCRAIRDQLDPVPGSSARTKGWTVEKYHELVHNLQGPDVKVVSTDDDAQIVAMLKESLEL
jgi:hypothetical protein